MTAPYDRGQNYKGPQGTPTVTVKQPSYRYPQHIRIAAGHYLAWANNQLADGSLSEQEKKVRELVIEVMNDKL